MRSNLPKRDDIREFFSKAALRKAEDYQMLRRVYPNGAMTADTAAPDDSANFPALTPVYRTVPMAGSAEKGWIPVLPSATPPRLGILGIETIGLATGIETNGYCGRVSSALQPKMI